MTTSEFCTKLSSMINDQETSSAVGGNKTARACDSCLRKRARWYCAADDAFLCQGCDASVHSANPLASRHKRVRLGESSFKRSESNPTNDYTPAWHKGFTRKARTPRQSKLVLKHNNKDKGRMSNNSPLVPEMEIKELSFEEETEAQLLYRVPILDPFAAELCNVSKHSENKHKENCKMETSVANESNAMFSDSRNDEVVCELENLPVFLPSEMELAADVESVLGTGLDDESCRIEGIGLIDCKEENVMDDCYEGGRVKTEDNEVEAIIDCRFDSGFDMSKDTIDWNFDYKSPATGDDQVEEKAVVLVVEAESMSSERKEIKKERFLRINFEDVISSWDNKDCPWTSGIRPEINPDDCWTDFLGMYAPGTNNWYGVGGGRIGSSDGGREARVSRYREKRKTRLFSKKIRYEVRKLNAEKRPRMKGRFVKKTSFAGGSAAAFPYIMSN